MPQSSVRRIQNLDVNFGSLSETRESGSPWFRKISVKKRSAKSVAVSVSLEGAK